MEQLVDSVIAWADSRGIFEKATIAGQYRKHVEEVGELGAALIDQDLDEVTDAIGDVLVTLIIQAEMMGLSVEGCLAQALSVIQDRNGTMVDGVFVKEA